MVHKNQKPTIIFISPRPYWDGIGEITLFTRDKNSLTMDSHFVTAGHRLRIKQIKKRTWTTPTPPYIRSNFGLHGPGTIIAMMSVIPVSVPCILWVLQYLQEVHIWSLLSIRDLENGFSNAITKIVVRAIRGLADSITYQTRQLRLYAVVPSDGAKFSRELSCGRYQWRLG